MKRFRFLAPPALILLALLLVFRSSGGSASAIEVIVGPVDPVRGEVVRYVLEIGDASGAAPAVTWSLEPSSAGLMTNDGRFVGYEPGPATIVATTSGLTARLPITIASREGPKGDFDVLIRGKATDRFNSDLWAHDDFAYTGTWLGSPPGGPVRLKGDRMIVWNIHDPDIPAITDTVQIDAAVVNDVKIRSDGKLAVVTHEGSTDRRNGITLLDLEDPFHPKVITRFTEGLEPGVHNVWIEGDFVYAAVDGLGNGLRIIDISDPASPAVVASFVAETSFLHDVLVRDGLAFLSHWDAGLIILDVGNGIAGGSPRNPVEVGRLEDLGGQTHNAWFWPEAGLVFMGERDHVTPGVMHVVDVRDLSHPKEVATFRDPVDTPHNFWLDESRGILYAAWYTSGVRAIDVTGELLGELDKQDREIAHLVYGTDDGCLSAGGTCTWAPQLHDNLIFLSDLNTGLWILEPDF